MSDNWLDTDSRPCQPGECDHHVEHRPCDRGWLDADHVCPCWAARRRVDVHHTDLDAIPTAGTPMPASVRAAWHTARKTLAAPSTVIPAWVPAEPAAPVAATSGESRLMPDPGELEPTPDPVLEQLPAAAALSTAERARLVDALNAARAAGWTDHQLAAHLHANTDPDRPPARLWLHVLKPRALAEHRPVVKAAA